MKAKTPDVSKVIEEMCQISVYRAQLLCMMAMQDTKGISERMINEVIMRWLEYAEEYRRNRDCGAGGKCLGLIDCFVLHAKRTEVPSDAAD